MQLHPTLTRPIRQLFRSMGYEVRRRERSSPETEYIRKQLYMGRIGDLERDAAFMSIYSRCKLFTLTSIEAMHSLYDAIRYVVARNIPGNIVECGVWKGGSIMLAASTLHQLGQHERKLYLYDTFAGLPEPSDKDLNFNNLPANEVRALLTKRQAVEITNEGWDVSPIEEVQANVAKSGYPSGQFVFVKGKVEDTIPRTVPDRIALLRLDTDWYESTYHELVHLYPRLSTGGILIVDDYGYWRGAQEAVDQFVDEYPVRAFMHRVDTIVRLFVKT